MNTINRFAAKLTCILLVLVCIVQANADAQFIQQGNKLVGTGAVGNAIQGVSVSLSSDGNTAIVGGAFDNSNVGAVWVYTRTGGVWSQQGSKLVGTGAVGSARQGISVSISSDGNTAVVGGDYDNNSMGAAWVYVRTGGVWNQQGSKLVGTGAVSIGAVYQGYSVSVSSDGNTAIVGGPSDRDSVSGIAVGAAWVYTRTSGVWSQQGNKLVGAGAVFGPSSVQQGCSVSISSDGNTAIVGGYADDNGVGAAWVYTRTGGVWSQQGSKLVGTGAAGTATQGWAVSISPDGSTATLGGIYDNSQLGAVWMHTRTGGVWSQQGSKLVGTGAVGSAQQGGSVSLSSDGNTAIVGGDNDNSFRGAAWVYTRTGGVWSQQGSKLVGTGALGNALQGRSVSLSSDGNTAIVGGSADNNNAGAAWVYTRVSIPSQVNLLSPVYGATIDADSIRCMWNRSAPSVTNYWFERAVDSLFSTPLIDSTLTDTSKVTRGLLTNTTYWWRVRAKNAAGWGPYSNARKFSAIFTDVAEGAVLPLEFGLKQNYPNPFNPSTLIAYDLPRSSHVTLSVFDLLGREIQNLVTGFQVAGSYKVTFESTGLASGVYLYRITAGQFVQTRKLLLLR